MKPIRQDMKEIMALVRDRRILIYLGASLFLLLINALTTLAFPALSARIIDQFFADKVIAGQLFFTLGIISLAGVLIAYLQSFIIALLGERFSYLARNRLYSKTIVQPEKYFIENDKSKILTVIMSDVNFVKQVLSQFVSMSIISVFMIIGSAILMLTINHVLALIVIVSVPLFMAGLTLFMRNIRELFMMIQGERDKFNRTIDENVKASMLIRVFTSENEEKDKFDRTNRNTFDLQKKIIRKFAIMIPGVYFVMFLSTFLITLIGGTNVINHTMTLGQISAFSTYVTMFTLPMMMLSMMSNIIGQALASLGRINSVLAYENDFLDGKRDNGPITSVQAENLFFSIGEKQILKDVSLEVKKGEKIGIIGLTGAGKSILIQLLMRFIEPASGRILVNGRDIKEAKIENIRKRTGIVFQDNYLLDDTIDENINFRRKMPRKDIAFARKVAEVDEFYRNHGPDYRVGELGKKLSGGQQQRLRIARAIAGRPDLLILDDSTSNLDVKTERKIISNIRESLRDIAIIIVSQKIASLSDCDRIYVMDSGKITEEGAHHDLLEKSILYKEIELTQKNRNS